jgi:NAD(P)-dependent dehydrogenase (short-subunit alcohol dehydrogenase family)
MSHVIRRPSAARRAALGMRFPREDARAAASPSLAATLEAPPLPTTEATTEATEATEAMNPPLAATMTAPLVATEPLAPPARRIALVTGGAQGLGAAIAEEFAAGGMGVVVADIQADRARQRAQELDPIGDDIAWCAIDVADRSSVEAAMDVTLARFGRLDVLVNNAGVDQTLPFEEISAEAFERVVGINLLGPVNMTRAALPALRASGRGMIVNIVSTAAKRAWPNASAYHASKWGLLGFSHALHTEARAYGVRVSAVICGGMRTPFILDRFPDVDPGTLQDPRTVARTIRSLVEADGDSVIPELTILPLRETSWP